VVVINAQDQAPGFTVLSIGRGCFGVEVAVDKLGKHLLQSACGPAGVDSVGALFVDHLRHQTVEPRLQTLQGLLDDTQVP